MTHDPATDAEMTRRAAQKEAVSKMVGARDAMTQTIDRVRNLEQCLRAADVLMRDMAEQIGPNLHVRVYKNGNAVTRPAAEVLAEGRAKINAIL